jgi:hydrogenase nickel incorporation protein HypA/HybF
MHELAITERVVTTVAERFGTAKVVRIQLAIGKLSGVAPDAVRFCFDVCSEGTSLAGARLDILEPPGAARCGDCQAAVALDDLIGRCACGSANLQLVGGQELCITEVEVA